MANTKKTKSELIGRQAIPITLDNSTKIDIDTNKVFVDNIIDAGLSGGLNTSELEKFTTISNNREQLYTIIDTMAHDSDVSSIIKTYADCACETADNGHIIWAESNDPKIGKFVNYLLNIINADKNIYAWTYNLVKYGDTYLRLYRESEYKDILFDKSTVDRAYSAHSTLNEDIDMSESVNLNIHSSNDSYSYYIEMVADPSTMFELTRLGKTYGYIEVPNTETGLNILNTYNGTNEDPLVNYRMKSTDVNIYQADDFVHACLEDSYSRFPERVEVFMTEDDAKNNKNASTYNVRRGKSLLADKYKVWREKSLLENAILLNRVTKSSVVRPVSVEVGNMPKEQVSLTLRRVKELFEQKSAVNNGQSFSEYNNPGPVENNIYFATHNGQGAITVSTIGGEVDVKNIADLDNWVNKFYSGFGIPKQYFGYTDDAAGFNGGSSLSILSSVFAKSVKHIQNATIQALTDAINLILINKGLKAYLNNFVLKMKAPETQEEKDYRDSLSNRINAINNMQSLFGDIEDRSRKLTILKSLISSLNYGDDIISTIDAEIEAADEAKKKEAEEAEAEARLEAQEEKAAAMEETEAEEEKSTEESTEATDADDLGMASVAMESIKKEDKDPLLEDIVDLVNEDLPTPEELDEKKDFSQNK